MSEGTTEGKPWQFPLWLMGLLGAFVAALIILAIEAVRTDGELVQDKSPLGKAKACVRSYLKDNLNDPDYQELEWGPLKSHENGYLISLRYRAKNAFNAWQMTTDLFYILGDSAARIEPDHPFADAYSD